MRRRSVVENTSKFVDVIPNVLPYAQAAVFYRKAAQKTWLLNFKDSGKKRVPCALPVSHNMEFFLLLTFYNVHVLGFVLKLWKPKIHWNRKTCPTVATEEPSFRTANFQVLEKVVGEKGVERAQSHWQHSILFMVVHHIFACEDNICNLIFATFGRPSWFLWLTNKEFAHGLWLSIDYAQQLWCGSISSHVLFYAWRRGMQLRIAALTMVYENHCRFAWILSQLSVLQVELSVCRHERLQMAGIFFPSCKGTDWGSSDLYIYVSGSWLWKHFWIWNSLTWYSSHGYFGKILADVRIQCCENRRTK